MVKNKGRHRNSWQPMRWASMYAGGSFFIFLLGRVGHGQSMLLIWGGKQIWASMLESVPMFLKYWWSANQMARSGAHYKKKHVAEVWADWENKSDILQPMKFILVGSLQLIRAVHKLKWTWQFGNGNADMAMWTHFISFAKFHQKEKFKIQKKWF